MPWGNDNGGGGPWGNNPNNRGNGGGNNGPTPPDIDELLRKSKDQFNGIFGGGSGKKPILLVIAIAFALWLFTGIYTVNTGEQGVVLRFGEFHRKTSSGLQYRLPTPLEQVIIIPI